MFNQQSDEPTSAPDEGTPSTMKKLVTTLVVLVAIVGLGAAGYFYKQYDELKKNPNKVSQDENKMTVDSVAKLIVVPNDEQPTIATVVEPEKLKDQAFFASATKGDKVLIYTKAKKAILYNPTTNRIVEVAPINIGANTAKADGTLSGTATEAQK